MEVSKDGSLDKTLLYLLKLTLTLVNLWNFPKTDLDKTLPYPLKLTLKHSGLNFTLFIKTA